MIVVVVVDWHEDFCEETEGFYCRLENQVLFCPLYGLTKRNASSEQIPHRHLAVYNAVVYAVGNPECGDKCINKRFCRFSLLLEYAHPVS